MNAAKLTDADIRAMGWLALLERLGPSGALRFALQTERGYGDYSAQRDEALGRLSVGELLRKMRGLRSSPCRHGARRKHG